MVVLRITTQLTEAIGADAEFVAALVVVSQATKNGNHHCANLDVAADDTIVTLVFRWNRTTVRDHTNAFA
jgi:hypothetical protein